MIGANHMEPIGLAREDGSWFDSDGGVGKVQTGGFRDDIFGNGFVSHGSDVESADDGVVVARLRANAWQRRNGCGERSSD